MEPRFRLVGKIRSYSNDCCDATRPQLPSPQYRATTYRRLSCGLRVMWPREKRERAMVDLEVNDRFEDSIIHYGCKIQPWEGKPSSGHLNFEVKL